MHGDDEAFEEDFDGGFEDALAEPFDPAKLRNRALALLSRREYARAELKAKLRPHCPDENTLDALLDDFQERNWLSDARFAEQWVHFRSQRYGPRRLVAELRQKGVASELISQAMANLESDEFSQARALWQRKFGQIPQEQKERLKQMRFLAGRGFSTEVIYRIIGGDEESY